MRRMLWMLAVVACGSGEPVDQTPRAQDPSGIGGYGATVETLRLDLGDRSGGAAPTVSALLWRPVRRVEAAPMLVLVHDEGVEVEDYLDLGSTLATWGYVVVAPQLDQPGRPRDHRGLRSDLRRVVTVLVQDPPTTEDVGIDVGAVGLVGHGRGAKTAVQYAATGAGVGLVVGLGFDDGVPEESAAYPRAIPDDVAAVTAPLALVDLPLAITGEPACVDVTEGAEAAFAAAPAGATFVRIPGAGLYDLLDPCAEGSGGSACGACALGEVPAVAREVVAAAVNAWAGLRLDEREGYGVWLDEDGLEGLAEGVTRQVAE